MNDLNQQLEDKKKELENLLKSMDGYGYSREDTIKDFEKWDYDMFGDKEDVHKYHKLKAEIAILEQAIAEKNEFIKEEIEFLYKIRNDEAGIPFYIKHPIEERIEQLQSQQGNSEREPQGTSTNCHNLADISNLLQKQRQEILDRISYIFEKYKVSMELEDSIQRAIYLNLVSLEEEIKQQLNQPKTEQ
jgi:hypothetical protein